jgi:hypothetical protein
MDANYSADREADPKQVDLPDLPTFLIAAIY